MQWRKKDKVHLRGSSSIREHSVYIRLTIHKKWRKLRFVKENCSKHLSEFIIKLLDQSNQLVVMYVASPIEGLLCYEALERCSVSTFPSALKLFCHD
jgi:hypothetical protein